MKKKKLLFLTNDMNLQLGGQGMSNIILMDYLSRDFSIKIVNQQFFKGTSNYKNVDVDFNVSFQKSFIKGLWNLKNTLSGFKKKDVDLIVISASPFSTLLYLFLIVCFNLFSWVRLVHFCRIDPLGGILSASRIPFILHPLGWWLYKELDYVVVQNPQMGDTFQKHYRVEVEKVVLIPNPVRPDYKKLIKDDKNVNIEATKPWITTITRLETKQKDPETLIRAFSLLRKRVEGASLIICGTGSDRQKLEDLASELNVENDVYFLGFVKNPFSVLKRSDVFVLSSRAEGFGKVIVEAQLSKVPVVATDCPVGPRWALDDGEAGILVPVGDEKKMAEAIFDLLNNNKKREKYVDRGLELSQRHLPSNFYKLCREFFRQSSSL